MVSKTNKNSTSRALRVGDHVYWMAKSKRRYFHRHPMMVEAVEGDSAVLLMGGGDHIRLPIDQLERV